MAFPRCDTCKFWTRQPTLEVVTKKLVEVEGECNGIATCWDWRLDEGDPGDMKAIMVDANAQLFTSPDFGCALWEAK